MAIRLNTKMLDRIRPKLMMMESYGAGAGGIEVDISSASGSSGIDLLTSYAQKLEAMQAREWRETNLWVARCVQYLKDRVAGEEHSVRIQNADDMPESVRSDVEDIQVRIENLLSRPNPQLTNDSFGGLWGAAIEDVLAINQGAVQKLLTKNNDGSDGEPYALKAIDGSLVSPNKKWDPDDPASPRYLVSQGGTKKPIPLKNNELIVLDASPTTYNPRGIAPMKVLRRFIQAELATFKRLHLVQVQATPGGVFALPNSAPGTPDALKDEYETNVQGSAGVVFMTVPAEAKYIEIGVADPTKLGSFDFYKIIKIGHAVAFGLQPVILGEFEDVNRASAGVSQDLSYDGVLTLLKLIRFYVNTEIVAAFGDIAAQYLYFTFDALEVEEEAEAADALRTKAGAKDFMRISEVRTAGGLEPIDLKDLPKGVEPFLEELWVPTLVGSVIIQLPWTYWFAFMKVDPDTMELIEPEPSPPLPGELPPIGTHVALPPGSPAAALAPPAPGAPAPNGHVAPATLPPGVVPPQDARAVQKALSLVKKQLETGKDPDGALAELEGINQIIESHFEGFIPSPDEQPSDQASGSSPPRKPANDV